MLYYHTILDKSLSLCLTEYDLFFECMFLWNLFRMNQTTVTIRVLKTPRREA